MDYFPNKGDQSSEPRWHESHDYVALQALLVDCQGGDSIRNSNPFFLLLLWVGYILKELNRITIALFPKTQNALLTH